MRCDLENNQPKNARTRKKEDEKGGQGEKERRNDGGSCQLIERRESDDWGEGEGHCTALAVLGQRGEDHNMNLQDLCVVVFQDLSSSL